MRIKRDGLVSAAKTKAIPKRVKLRRLLPPHEFVFPKERAYPIPDAYHAGLALQALIRTAGRHGVNQSSRIRALKVLESVKDCFPGIYAGEGNLVKEVKRIYGIHDTGHDRG